MTDTPKAGSCTEAEMIPVRKFRAIDDNIEVTGYKYNGKIYVDGVRRIGPGLVKDTAND